MVKEKCVIETCNNDRFEECCYGMCSKHCGEKKHHYAEKNELGLTIYPISTKYPNILRTKT